MFTNLVDADWSHLTDESPALGGFPQRAMDRRLRALDRHVETSLPNYALTLALVGVIAVLLGSLIGGWAFGLLAEISRAF